MSVALRRSTLSLYREFVRCSSKIPQGVARERFVRNIRDIFVLNTTFTTPEQAEKLVQQYVYWNLTCHWLP